LEVLKEKDTLALIIKRYELHPNQISDWKKQFIDAAPTLFEPIHKAAPASTEPDVALLYEQIGRLQVELAFFKKSFPMSPDQRRPLMYPAGKDILRQQCRWLGLHRSTYRTG
jgi:transposase-like protein